MTEERSIETKVGILILVSLLILCAFVLVMGGFSLKKKFSILVDFDNPGGLQTGAPVRLAGIRVGTVDELSFMGGVIDPLTHRRTLVRAKLNVEERVRPSLHSNALFYVTTQGVLGEQFLAIEPGTPDQPNLDLSTPIKGIDPPRLDLFLSRAYDLLDTTVTALHNNRELIAGIAENTSGLLKGLNGVISENKDGMSRTLKNLEELSREARDLAKDAHGKLDDPRIDRTLTNIDRIAASVQRDSEPLLKDTREAMANINRAAATVGSPEEQAKLKKALNEIAELAARANATATDIQDVVKHVKKGQGTVGALVMDEEIYDDIQEMVRDLKHNPWKFLWRE